MLNVSEYLSETIAETKGQAALICSEVFKLFRLLM